MCAFVCNAEREEPDLAKETVTGYCSGRKENCARYKIVSTGRPCPPDLRPNQHLKVPMLMRG
jgi:hypothetical protein